MYIMLNDVNQVDPRNVILTLVFSGSSALTASTWMKFAAPYVRGNCNLSVQADCASLNCIHAACTGSLVFLLLTKTNARSTLTQPRVDPVLEASPFELHLFHLFVGNRLSQLL